MYLNEKEAEELCIHLHQHQNDWMGNAYYHHPFGVRDFVTNSTEHERIAALLHDTLEDVKINNITLVPDINGRALTEDDLKMFRVPDESIEIIKLVTRLNGDERKNFKNGTEYYLYKIQKIIDSNNIGAIKLKFADNKHNSLPSRLIGLDDWQLKSANGLREKRYIPSMKMLAEAALKHEVTLE